MIVEDDPMVRKINSKLKKDGRGCNSNLSKIITKTKMALAL